MPDTGQCLPRRRLRGVCCVGRSICMHMQGGGQMIAPAARSLPHLVPPSTARSPVSNQRACVPQSIISTWVPAPPHKPGGGQLARHASCGTFTRRSHRCPAGAPRDPSPPLKQICESIKRPARLVRRGRPFSESFPLPGSPAPIALRVLAHGCAGLQPCTTCGAAAAAAAAARAAHRVCGASACAPYPETPPAACAGAQPHLRRQPGCGPTRQHFLLGGPTRQSISR